MACKQDGLPLNGSRFSAANASPQILQFQRKNGGDDLSDAGAIVTLTAGEISIVLTSGAELTNTVNTAQKQEFKYLITQDQKTQLLNGADSVTVAYSLSVTPSAGTALAGDYDSDYTGTFEIITTGTGTLGTPVPTIETIDLESAVTGDFPVNRTLNHLVKFINAASAGTAVGETNPITMASDQVWYPTVSPSTNNGANWARLAIDPVHTGIQAWASGLSVRLNQVMITPAGSLVRSVSTTDRVTGSSYDATEAAFFALVQLGTPLTTYPGTSVFLYQGRQYVANDNLYSWPADGPTVGASFDDSEWTISLLGRYIPSSLFSAGDIRGLEIPTDRLYGADARYPITTTSGTLSNIQRLFDSTSDQGATVLANESATIEIDLERDSGVQGFVYLSGYFVLTHKVIQPPLSVLLEANVNNHATPSWQTIASWTNFSPNRINEAFNNGLIYVKRLRLTITARSDGPANLISLRWFAGRTIGNESPVSLMHRNSSAQLAYCPSLTVANPDASLSSGLHQGYIKTTPMTVAELTTLTPAVAGNGATAYVSDGIRPNNPVYSDGANWRYFADNVIVS